VNPRDVTGEGASSILRAVGSLLVALSGGDQAQAERTLSTMQGELQGSEPPAQPSSTAQPSRPSEAQSAPQQTAPTPPRAYPQPQGRSARSEARVEASSSGVSGGAPSDLLDKVEFVLADARDRAQAIIDESTERARELIRQERAAHAAPVTGIDPSAFDDLRRGLRGLVTEVRDIQQRLARIEQLIRDQNARTASHATSGATEAQPPSASVIAPAPEPSVGYVSYPEPRAVEAEPLPAWQAPEPIYDEPATDEPVPEAPSEEPRYGDDAGFEESEAYAEPDFETSAPSAEQEQGAPEPYDAAEAPPAPAPVPPRSPFSVVPPQRREWGAPGPDESPRAPAWESMAPEAPEAPAAYEPPQAPSRTYGSAEAAPELAPDPTSWDDEAYDQPDETGAPNHSSSARSSSPLVTFLPSDGAITLRVAPVPGFQGLMRIQDALTRLPAVRHASVEAYSQGEARLRIELSDTSDSDEIAEGLSRTLRGPARVEDASEVNRELLITLR